jgi:TPR repeat protein
VKGRTRQDLGEAVRWFRQAAVQGNAEAENSLGFLYDCGGPNAFLGAF